MESNLSSPFFSVIIPTFERNDLLAKCLECLAPGRQEGMQLVRGNLSAQREPGATYEVIVSDDGRTTTAQTMVRERFPWALWVAGPRTGPAGNRNCGASLAKGIWLAFTDDDCLPNPGWLLAYFAAIKEQKAIKVFEGKTMPDRPRQTLAEHAPVGIQGGNLWSCNFVIQRSAFESMAGFDEHFRVCLEDSDFALRVRGANLSFPFIEGALVTHPWRVRKHLSDGWKSNRAEVADHLLFKSKHFQEGKITPLRMLRMGFRIFWCDVTFIVKNCDLKGISHAVMNLLHILNIAWQCGVHKPTSTTNLSISQPTEQKVQPNPSLE